MANTVQLTKNGQPVFPVTDVSLVMGLNYRPYDSENPNGMGYLVLKKNKTFAEQVTEANTIYEIRYEFDLGGEFVTIPAGCMLTFNGGRVANGTLAGSNTRIDAENVEILDVTISGTWLVHIIRSEWFHSNIIDNAIAMNNAGIYTEIVFNGDFALKNNRVGLFGVPIVANTKVTISGTITKTADSSSTASMFEITGDNVTIEGGVLDGNKSAFSSSQAYGHGIYMEIGVQNLHITGCTIQNCYGDGIYIGGPNVVNINKLIDISSCTITGCRRNGISIVYGQQISIRECIISDINATAPGAAIDIEPNYAHQVNRDIIISDCEVSGCRTGVGVSGSQSAISNVSIKNVTMALDNYDLSCVISNCSTVKYDNCVFDLSGTKAKTYNINISSSQNVVFENCIFRVTSTSGYFFAGKAAFSRCKIETAEINFAQALVGKFRDCDIVCNTLSASCASDVLFERCSVTHTSSVLSGTATAYAQRAIFRDNHFKVTAAFYPFNMQYVRDFVFEGNIFELAGNRNLFNVQNGENVRINSNRFIIGSNNNCVVIASTCSSCQVKDNEFEVAEGVTHTASKVSGINTTSSTTNKIGDPFFAGGKMVVYNGTSVVNMDGSALS